MRIGGDPPQIVIRSETFLPSHPQRVWSIRSASAQHGNFAFPQIHVHHPHGLEGRVEQSARFGGLEMPSRPPAALWTLFTWPCSLCRRTRAACKRWRWTPSISWGVAHDLSDWRNSKTLPDLEGCRRAKSPVPRDPAFQCPRQEMPRGVTENDDVPRFYCYSCSPSADRPWDQKVKIHCPTLAAVSFGSTSTGLEGNERAITSHRRHASLQAYEISQ